MTTLDFTQVDAFAEAPFTGNPAAVMPLDQWLDDAMLQAIAAENNLSETAFTIPVANGAADYELRWFTPATEVALCGHATFAAGHVLLARDKRDRVTFATRKAGLLAVVRDGDGYRMALPAWKPVPRDLDATVAATGGAPVETLWHEGRYAVLVYRDEASVRALTPDFRTLASLGDILTIATAPGDATDIVSRAFAPGAGIDEDPVTGSAHAVVVPYWAERLGRASFKAFQASRRGGLLGCELAGDTVYLLGKCTTVIEGRFSI